MSVMPGGLRRDRPLWDAVTVAAQKCITDDDVERDMPATLWSMRARDVDVRGRGGLVVRPATVLNVTRTAKGRVDSVTVRDESDGTLLEFARCPDTRVSDDDAFAIVGTSELLTRAIDGGFFWVLVGLRP
jgi:hypothetical protein